MFYENVLENFAMQLHKNLYILPSSIHECILIPEEEGMYQEALTEIVTEINESQVDPKEVLSDQAYFYSAEDKRVHL